MLTMDSWLWGPRSRIGLMGVLAVVLLDQVHKFWMLDIFRIQDKGRVMVTPFLDLIYVKNTGISYGLLNFEGVLGQAMLAGFAALAVALFWGWLARGSHSVLAATSLGFIMGGALGNAIDRLRLGGVADFFLFHIGGWEWYVFNIADAAIVAGAAGLLYDMARSSHEGVPKD